MNIKCYQIGEFSKLTGVSIKSLRYYDEIGVLKPAYKNINTGYRYYMPDQIMVVDVIKLCLAFDYPLLKLKDEKKYNLENFKKFILESKVKINKQLEHLKRLNSISEDILTQIHVLSNIETNGQFYNYRYPACKLLLCEWKLFKDDVNDYIDKIAQLREKAEKLGLMALSHQGILNDYKENKAYAFLSIQGDYHGEDCLLLGNNLYSCYLANYSKLYDIGKIVLKHSRDVRYIFYINTKLYNYKSDEKNDDVEVLCLTEEEYERGLSEYMHNL